MKTDGACRVVVIGASFAGLFAAAAMARAGAEVTVLERDRLSDSAEPRPGVPQGVQPHILLHRGLLAAESLLPGIEEDVLDAGGVRLDTARMPWLGRHGWAGPSDLPSYDVLSVSRPVLELLVRRRVLGIAGVTLRDGFRVTGLTHTSHRWEVRGSEHHEALDADVVVDCSGRGSRLPHWLAELGYPIPAPQNVEAKLGYASRRYQGTFPPLASGLVIVATPESPVGSTILPVEHGHWLVLAAGYGERRPSRDADEFTDFLSSLRDPAAADLVRTLQPVGDVAVYRQTGNRRIPYGRATSWPPGLLVAGDALCAFNPIYGQGITVAAMQAELLVQAVTEVHDVRGTRRWQRRLAAVTDLPWSVATGEDVRQPTSDGRQTTAQRVLTAWTDRMSRLAVAGDPACGNAFIQVYHLVGAPSLLFSPRVVAAVVGSWFRGVPPPRPRPPVLEQLTTQRA